MRRAVKIGTILVLAVSLTACGRGDEAPELMNIQSKTRTPDEFRILPNRPIEMPEDMASLPPPSPGGINRVDPDPEADAIAALGGNPARAREDSRRPSSDAGLATYTTRYGVTPEIRTQLAQEDLRFRQRNNGRVLERWFNQNVYFDAYASQSLNQGSELERFRRAGVPTVAAPPPPSP